jgi:hypothetical protein
MHTGGWRDVAVDAEVQLGIEPSSAVKIVVRAITVTLRTLRECSRGGAQQQRHCHDKFVALMVQSPRGRVQLPALLLSPAALFIGSAYSQKFVQSGRQDSFSSPGFPCLKVDGAPTVMIGSLEEIEIGVRNYVMVIVFNRPARLPPSCGAAFRSTRSHSFCAGSYLLSVSSARRGNDVRG